MSFWNFTEFWENIGILSASLSLDRNQVRGWWKESPLRNTLYIIFLSRTSEQIDYGVRYATQRLSLCKNTRNTTRAFRTNSTFLGGFLNRYIWASNPTKALSDLTTRMGNCQIALTQMRCKPDVNSLCTFKMIIRIPKFFQHMDWNSRWIYV